MLIKTILNDLAEASPIISNSIEESLSSTIQDEFDPIVSENKLITESVQMLINLLKQNGIEFYNTDSVNDRYSIGFIITLYKYFIPNNISLFIKNTPGYLDIITSSIINVSDDEYIVHLLEALSDLTQSSYYQEMYNFLHDKIVSTNDYVTVVSASIDQLVVQSDNIDHNYSEKELIFLDKVAVQRRWFHVTISELIFKAALPIEHARINQIISRFSLNYTIPENMIILAKYDELIETNKQFMQSFMLKLHKNSEFHVEHYNSSDIAKLPLCLVISIIITQFVDNHLFNITPDFKQLIQFAASDIPIESVIKMVPES